MRTLLTLLRRPARSFRPQSVVSALLLSGFLVVSASCGPQGPPEDLASEIIPTEAARVLERGLAQANQGLFEEALEAFLEAERLAPESRRVNFHLASTLAELGEVTAALGFAKKSVPADCCSSSALADSEAMALLGWLEARQGGAETSEGLAARLSGHWPEHGDPYWQELLFLELRDWKSLGRLAVAGQASEERPLHFRVLEISALIGGGEWVAAEEAFLRLSEAQQADEGQFLGRLLRLQRNPAAGLDDVVQHWGSDSESPFVVERLVASAKGSGQFALVQKGVAEFLVSPKASAKAWLGAELWFSGPGEWADQLDLGLEERSLESGLYSELGLLRLQAFDSIRERAKLVEFADGLRRAPTPYAETFELHFLAHRWPLIDREIRSSSLEIWIRDHPGSLWAHLLLLSQLTEDDPAEARLLLSSLKAAAPSGTPLGAALEGYEVGVLLAEGKLAEARRLSEGLRADQVAAFLEPTQIFLDRAEVAFHQQDFAGMAGPLEQVLGVGDSGHWPAALMLRWAGQLAVGDGLTYDADVKRWMSHRETSKETGSVAGQAILLAEGKVGQEWVDLAVGSHYPESLELVTFFKQAASGTLDRRQLERIAGASFPHDPAPRLARSLLSRLAGGA